MLTIDINFFPARRRNVVHITFCADKGRHNWVAFSNVMPFTNKENFEKLASEVLADSKKKNTQYGAAFLINPKMKAQWEKAIEDAEELSSISIEKRNDFYDLKIKKEVQRLVEINKKKRMSLVNEDEKSKKRKIVRIAAFCYIYF